jgi:16S rRNA (uracil1498-N3)-methyltransferase
MRAHYLEDLKIQDEYVLTGDSLHHLVNVVRVEAGEELMLLNGLGLIVKTQIETIAKRGMALKYLSSEILTERPALDLVLGMPKRDALELCFKEAVELGFGKIFLVKSDYSQMKFPEQDRIKSLLVSALEQSNAPFLPVVEKAEWISISYADYAEVLMMDSQVELRPLEKRTASGKILLVVGPEGGFSSAERENLMSQKNIRVLRLQTPILRTPTALAAGAGIVWQRLLD